VGLGRPEGRAVRELEFLPQDYIRARFQRRIGFIRSWLLLALGLAMVLWSLQMGASVRDAKAELEALQDADTAVDADVEKVHTLRSEAQSYEQRIELLRSLRPQITASDMMVAMTDLLPAGVVLDEVNLDHPDLPAVAGRTGRDEAHVRLSGWAPSETAVTETLRAMEASTVFQRSVLAESKGVGGQDRGRRSFVVEADVIPPPAKE